jgi:membrane protein
LLALIPMLAVVMSITSGLLKKEGEDKIDQFIVKMVAGLVPPAEVSTNSATGSQDGDSASATNQAATVAESSSKSGVTSAETVSPPSHKLRGVAASEDQKNGASHKANREIHRFIQNTRSGALGVTGSVLVIFAAISMLGRIEATFNDIWGVVRGRSWFMRTILYWSVFTLAPVLLVTALALATGPHLESTKHLLATLPVVGNFIVHFGFQVLPVLLLCLTFAAFYMLMPNTRVHWCAALVGGFVAAVLFHLNNMASVLYVSRVVSNSKIYGSLGLVPVFMIGLYFSWLILLFGAQVAYAFQNRATYLEEKQIETINQRGREFVALRVMTYVSQRYLRGEAAPTVVEIGEELNVPTRLVQQLMQTLGAARLVVETTGLEAAYLPSRPMEAITCHDILLALRAAQGQELATRDEPARAEVYGEFQRIQEAERQAAESVTMLALANRAQAQVTGGDVKALGAAS